MARFWGLPLAVVKRMPLHIYQEHRDHYYDYLEYQQEAIDEAKAEAEGM